MTPFGSRSYYFCIMIYKEYFIKSEFEDVWHTLKTYYKESEAVRKLYKTLFYTIRNLDIDSEHSQSPLKIVYDFENMIHIAGAPDTIEWMTGREVILDEVEYARDNDTGVIMQTVADLAAHLLYWSTLYDFRTQTRYHKDCVQRIHSSLDDELEYPVIDLEKEQSLKRKQCYYWKETIANDSAIDWSYILGIMRKRMEYHIGYHRFTDRFVNSRHYVSRMELCSQLLNLAGDDCRDLNGCYVNTRNALRFVGRIFGKYDLESLLKEKTEEDSEYRMGILRSAKAYQILWRFLDHNHTYWWD